MKMGYRFATEQDLDLLAEWNHQLTQDEARLMLEIRLETSSSCLWGVASVQHWSHRILYLQFSFRHNLSVGIGACRPISSPCNNHFCPAAILNTVSDQGL